MNITILDQPNFVIINSGGTTIEINKDLKTISLGGSKMGILTQEQLDAFDSVSTICNTVLSTVRPEKLEKVTFKNGVAPVITIQKQSGGITTVFLNELSSGNQAMAEQFLDMCELIKPNFLTTEWTSPDKLEVDDVVINISTQTTPEQEIFIFQCGEMLKGVSAGIL